MVDGFFRKYGLACSLVLAAIAAVLYSALSLVRHAQKGERIVFADAYDSHWQMTIGKQKTASQPFENSLNSFVLLKSGTYTASLYYTPQTWG